MFAGKNVFPNIGTERQKRRPSQHGLQQPESSSDEFSYRVTSTASSVDILRKEDATVNRLSVIIAYNICYSSLLS
ncbi:hypothetical protein ANCCAN_01877 [Ancylostoma caninum]|uniref:Uncharacterized protein n=1 Tax=Ancylostoma caninum TaxID=29170 RepID=A0A368H8Z0_ANCCA|nr:hypothetical protein ANCCAN_01877 [Ancylostoma caninum]